MCLDEWSKNFSRQLRKHLWLLKSLREGFRPSRDVCVNGGLKRSRTHMTRSKRCTRRCLTASTTLRVRTVGVRGGPRRANTYCDLCSRLLFRLFSVRRGPCLYRSNRVVVGHHGRCLGFLVHTIRSPLRERVQVTRSRIVYSTGSCVL